LTYIAASLKWESYEQTNLWSFIIAELKDCPTYITKCISFVLDRLDSRDYPESYIGLFHLLKNCTPSITMFSELLSKKLMTIDLADDVVLPDWDTLVNPTTLFQVPYPLSHWICTILSSWLDQHYLYIQEILFQILSYDYEVSSPSSRDPIMTMRVHTLDLIYFWFLYRQQQLISTNHHLIHSHSLINLIRNVLHTYHLATRYPFMESWLIQRGKLLI
jgi:hypothetical protein